MTALLRHHDAQELFLRRPNTFDEKVKIFVFITIGLLYDIHNKSVVYILLYGLSWSGCACDSHR